MSGHTRFRDLERKGLTMKVYVVLIDDTHCDTDVELFSDPDLAVKFAKELAVQSTLDMLEKYPNCGNVKFFESYPGYGYTRHEDHN